MKTIWGQFKIFENQKMRFLNNITVPKNVKGGPLGSFRDPFCRKTSKQMKGHNLMQSDFFKKQVP